MLLPFHPQPLQGEILSSWMARLAYSNGFKLHQFYSSLLGYKGQIWNRDIDRHPNPALLALLEHRTGVPVETLSSMTLQSYSGILFEELPLIGNANWILPLGVYHRKRSRPGMQFCPICLQMSPKPYYRKAWRLAMYVVCEFHQCVMQSQCPKCSAPIAFHRNGIGRTTPLRYDAMHTCHQCGFDLRWASSRYIDWPDAKSWARLIWLTSLFEMGAWDIGQSTPPNPFPFFFGLRALVNIIWGRNGGRLRETIYQELQLKANDVKFGKDVDFEKMDVRGRLQVMLILCWLIEDWPVRFVWARRGNKLPLASAKADRDWLPYWIEKAFKA